MSDINIVSQMNGDMCVNISVVLDSPRISKLTQDSAHLLTAMRQTNKVILDEAANTAKPSFKLQRNTIIIRDVAADTPQEVRFVTHVSKTSVFFNFFGRSRLFPVVVIIIYHLLIFQILF